MSLFIRDWSAVSPLGVGRGVFSAAVMAHWSEQGESSWGVLPPQATLFESFNKKQYLGKKGVRGMNPLGAYATTCSQQLITESPDLQEHDPSRMGVVLGTASGSLKSHIDFIRELHIQERVEWIDPLQFPQTVMNCAAGQVSIWHKFTGVNTTVSSGYHSGVTAFEYADNLFQNQRVNWVLVGCVEEYSLYSSCLFPSDRSVLRESQQLGEGCVTFLAAPEPDQATIAELFGYRRLAYMKGRNQEQRVAALEGLIDTTLAAREGSPGLRRICFNGFSSSEQAIIETLQQGTSAAADAQSWCSNAVVADCLSATTGFQLGLLLAAHTDTLAEAAVDLAVTFDPAGGVATTFIEQRANT